MEMSTKPRIQLPPMEDRFSETERRIISAIQHGLPLVSRPYAAIAESLGISEAQVIEHIRKLLEHGDIKRMGVVVRHRELGYRANAMVVWDIPDERVAELGRCLGQFDFVTLCYRRPRRLPDWPYNLFCMIHGQNRTAVLDKVSDLVNNCQLQDIRREVLFSRRRFKQRGAIYTPSATGPTKS